MASAISVDNVSKNYDHVVALDRVSVSFVTGQIVGLIGPNGSGKSTLGRVLAGYVPHDSGSVEVCGRNCHFAHPQDAILAGISLLPQFPALCPRLSALENLFLGQEETRRPFGLRLLNWKLMNAKAGQSLEQVGLDSRFSKVPAGDLSGGQKKSLAIARALLHEPKVMIFDEPMASLGVHQQQKVIEIISSCRSRGMAILFVSHNADDVLRICDRVVALRLGRVVADLMIESVTTAALAAYMAE